MFNKDVSIADMNAKNGFYIELDIEDILWEIHNLYLSKTDIDLSNIVFDINQRYPIIPEKSMKKPVFYTILRYLNNENIDKKDIELLNSIDFFNRYSTTPFKGFLYTEDFLRLLIIKIYTINEDNCYYIRDDINKINFEEIIEKYDSVENYIYTELVNTFSEDYYIVLNYLNNVYNKFFYHFVNFKNYLIAFDSNNTISIYTHENILYNYMINLEDQYKIIKDKYEKLLKDKEKNE